MRKRSQRKGADGERELAAVLREYGYNIRRGGCLSFGEIPDLTGLDGVHIECKRCEKFRLSEWIKQAERDSQHFKDGLPAVFHRRNQEPWQVTMNLSDWTYLYLRKKTEENGKERIE